MDGFEEINGAAIVYSRSCCAQSLKAKLLLTDLSIPYLDMSLDAFPQVEEQLAALVGDQFQTPQIFFNNVRVSGYGSLRRLVATPDLWQEVLEMLNDDGCTTPSSVASPMRRQSIVLDEIIPDEFDKMVHMMRKANLIKDRPGPAQTHRNAIKGEDFVNWIMKERQMKRSEALLMGQKLIDKHFGQQQGYSTFNTDKFYQVPDDDPNMPLNLPNKDIETVSMSVSEFNDRLRQLSDAIFNEILSSDHQLMFYEKLEKCESFDAYKDFMPQLAHVDLSRASVTERLAIFINIYNIMLVHILYKYGPHMDIWQRRKYLNSTYYLINNQRYSLQSILNGILRGNRKGLGMLWKPFGKDDARRNNVTEELRQNCRHFLSQRENFKIDTKKQVVYLSGIFKLYEADFGNMPEHAVDFIKEVLEPSAEREILSKAFRPYASAEHGQYTINYLEFGTDTNIVQDGESPKYQ